MAFLRARRDWALPEREATPERLFLDRRAALKLLGGAVAALAGCEPRSGTVDESAPGAVPRSDTSDLYPAKRNPDYSTDRPLTEETVAARINNFYEFHDGKDAHRFVESFETRPWTIEVGGLVEKPVRLGIDDLVRRMPLEERVYRLRCVEAWSMTVPWTGFPMRALLDLVRPASNARFVRFVSFHRPAVASGQRRRVDHPWPYREGLTLAEAAHELTLLATGIYGHELPKQHGAPIRLVVPWKYGFKSIKSVVRIELTADRPATFWNTLVPHEYGFEANVDPARPHPRWSQATERIIDTGERVRTLPYNGYAELVAGLYPDAKA